MNKIIVYEHVNFGGLSMEFTSDVPNLVDVNFNNCISSLKVFGNPWVAYTDTDYKGYLYIYEEGEYNSVECSDYFSSLQMVREDLSNPQITLYEHSDYGGRAMVLTCETNLGFGSFNDTTSSHKVQRGVWILYQHYDRGGAQMLARASQNMPNYGWFEDRVSHLRPLRPGKPSVKTEVQWDKKEKSLKSVVIDSICVLNYGSHDQTFSTELSREYEGSVTESFSFSNSTEISWGTTFEVNIGVVKTELNLSGSEAFTVEKGSSNTKTEKKGIKVSLPATVPPHTKLTVNVVRKEMDAKIPVKMTITQGFTSKVEYGQYRCQSGNAIITEYREEKI